MRCRPGVKLRAVSLAAGSLKNLFLTENSGITQAAQDATSCKGKHLKLLYPQRKGAPAGAGPPKPTCFPPQAKAA